MAQNTQFVYADTIVAMKKAMARADDASDSDDSIHHHTNRSNKLKRKAKFVTEGRLSQADGPRVYKRPLLYNGYMRNVIGRKPRRVDADGDSVHEDDDERNMDLTDSEDDPYEETKIEEILMPLTSAADLDKHPSLSLPYKSKILEDMIKNTQQIAWKEQEALWHVKQIMIKFRGDSQWIPTGNLQTEQDIFTLQPFPSIISAVASNGSVVSGDDANRSIANMDWETNSVRPPGSTADQIGESLSSGPQIVDDGTNGAQSKDVDMINGSTTNAMDLATSGELSTNGEQHLNGHTAGIAKPDSEGSSSSTLEHAGNGSDDAKPAVINGIDNGTDPDTAMLDGGEGLPAGEDDEEDQPSHRMTTRAKAQAETEPTASQRGETPLPAGGEIPAPIHPFFIPTPASLPAPPPTRTELLRLLAAYVQKQEEVVRQSHQLLRGLRKALRLRKTVHGWCRAEGHVGEMSDGEDWYDMEEWGLEEPLRKGNDEEDEEVVTGKPKRNRRTVA